PGTYTSTAHIKTASGCVTTGEYTIIIDPPDPLPTIHLLATVCIPVDIPIAGTIKGDLPPDLFFIKPALKGTPKVRGSFQFTVTYDDPKRCPREQSYDITIDCPKTILPDDLPHILPFYKPVDIVISRADLKKCFTYSVDPAT